MMWIKKTVNKIAIQRKERYMMAVTPSFQKKIEDLQIKIMEQNVEEAKLKTEKARVELETAKIQQKHVQQFFLRETSNGGVLQ
jgi:hypothetical protein